jgi:hypothetical protein
MSMSIDESLLLAAEHFLLSNTEALSYSLSNDVLGGLWSQFVASKHSLLERGIPGKSKAVDLGLCDM